MSRNIPHARSKAMEPETFREDGKRNLQELRSGIYSLLSKLEYTMNDIEKLVEKMEYLLESVDNKKM